MMARVVYSHEQEPEGNGMLYGGEVAAGMWAEAEVSMLRTVVWLSSSSTTVSKREDGGCG